MLTVDLGRAAVVPGMWVLDVGCGGGRHTFACLKAGAHVVALDAHAPRSTQSARWWARCVPPARCRRARWSGAWQPT